MDTPMTISHSFRRQPLAALGKLAVTALIGLAALMSYVEVVIFNLAPSGFAFIAIPLLLAGVIATGWRWAPLLGAIWCGLMLVMNLQFRSEERRVGTESAGTGGP